MLTPRVLDLGVAYVRSTGLWDVARPHLEWLVERTNESCSIAQLDGSDIVYVARVSVPKIVALAVQIGTRFPALPTSLGKVLLAALPTDEAARVLAEPTRSGLESVWHPGRAEWEAELRGGARAGLGGDRRATGPGHPFGGRSTAGRALGRVVASVNVNRARRRDLDGGTARRLSAAPPPGRRRDQPDFARLESAPHAVRPSARGARP
ncbi:IclR family transcriptional regulator domain-containing protein [Streptomyces sp. L7]